MLTLTNPFLEAGPFPLWVSAFDSSPEPWTAKVGKRQRAELGVTEPMLEPVFLMLTRLSSQAAHEMQNHVLPFCGLNESYCRCFMDLPQSTVCLLWVLVKNSVREGGGWGGNATVCLDRD